MVEEEQYQQVMEKANVEEESEKIREHQQERAAKMTTEEQEKRVADADGEEKEKQVRARTLSTEIIKEIKDTGVEIASSE